MFPVKWIQRVYETYIISNYVILFKVCNEACTNNISLIHYKRITKCFY